MNLIKISIVIAIAGIAALFLIVRYSSQETVKISELKQGQIERITGIVNSVYVSKDGHVFFKVADTSGELSVIAFKNSNIDNAYEVEVGDQISVLGRVEEYKGSMEIIASDIKKV